MLSAQAEFILVRDAAVAQVVYDQRGGAGDEELGALEAELVEQLAQRAGVAASAVQVVQLPPALRGLGLRPLETTRDAAVLRAGLAALTRGTGGLGDAVWNLVARPAGTFFRRLHGVLATAGYECDADQREVRQGGKLVVRPPSSLEQAARRLDAQRANAAVAAQRTADDGTDHARSAVSRLITAHGAKRPVDDTEWQAAVRLHCGLAEPAVAGV